MATRYAMALLSAAVFGLAGAVEFEDQRLTPDPLMDVENFGSGVAIDGAWAAVGARGTSQTPGAAAVYEVVGGALVERQWLSASDGAAHNHFGLRLAIDGDTLVVAANRDDENGVDAGAVYVFERDGGTWGETQKLLAADGAANDWFGSSVALSGDRLAVGAYQHGIPEVNGGAVYVYLRNPSSGLWELDQKLTPSDIGPGFGFGASVAIDGDTLIAGAPGWRSTIPAEDENGAAYVFVRGATGWDEDARLVAGSGAGDAVFGFDVALRGALAAVGAWNQTGGVAFDSEDEGAAYLFRRAEGLWTQEARLRPANLDLEPEADYGLYLALTDELLLVSHGDAQRGGVETGMAHVFAEVGGVWSEIANLAASDGADGGNLAYSAAADGSRALLGDPTLQGAYVYELQPFLGPGPADLNEDGIIDAADIQSVINAVLGIASAAGDVNGDGAADAADIQRVVNAVLGIGT